MGAPLSRPLTKTGKHGTLYRYEITYRDYTTYNEIGYDATQRVWAYNIEHAEEKFYDAIDADGWRAVSIRRVNENGTVTGSPIHKL